MFWYSPVNTCFFETVSKNDKKNPMMSGSSGVDMTLPISEYKYA